MLFAALAALTVLTGCTRRTGDYLLNLAVSADGRIFASSSEVTLAEYDVNGTMLEDFGLEGYLAPICADGGYLYAYSFTRGEFIKYGLADRSESVICAIPDLAQIKEGAVIGGALYVLAVHKTAVNTGVLTVTSDNYMNLYEKLFKIDLSTGEVADLGIEGLIRGYWAADGEFYLYGHTDGGRYVFYRFDAQKDELCELAYMDDIGYIFSFIYEDGLFTVCMANWQVVSRALDDVAARVLAVGLRAVSMRMCGGKLIYLNQTEGPSGSRAYGSLAVLEEYGAQPHFK